MKVLFPGPNVSEEAGKGRCSFGAFGVELVPGENEIPEEAAKALLASGVVRVEVEEQPRARRRRVKE